MNKTHEQPSSARVSRRVGGRLSWIVGSLGSLSELGVAESLQRAQRSGVQHSHLDCAGNLGKGTGRCLYLRGPGFRTSGAGREAGPGRRMHLQGTFTGGCLPQPLPACPSVLAASLSFGVQASGQLLVPQMQHTLLQAHTLYLVFSLPEISSRGPLLGWLSTSQVPVQGHFY